MFVAPLNALPAGSTSSSTGSVIIMFFDSKTRDLTFHQYVHQRFHRKYEPKGFSTLLSTARKIARFMGHEISGAGQEVVVERCDPDLIASDRKLKYTHLLCECCPFTKGWRNEGMFSREGWV